MGSGHQPGGQRTEVFQSQGRGLCQPPDGALEVDLS